jgi:divalent metal cation (Fe/Co/Zn/Cd) transporter
VDSFIEVTSGAALLWRMSTDADVPNRERREKKLTLQIVGASFLALAAFVAFEAISNLFTRKNPEESVIGVALACASLVVMPPLSRAKRRSAPP